MTHLKSPLLAAALTLALVPPAISSAPRIDIGATQVLAGRTANVQISMHTDPWDPAYAVELYLHYDQARLGTPSCTSYLGATCLVFGNYLVIYRDAMCSVLWQYEWLMLGFPVRSSAPAGTYWIDQAERPTFWMDDGRTEGGDLTPGHIGVSSPGPGPRPPLVRD